MKHKCDEMADSQVSHMKIKIVLLCYNRGKTDYCSLCCMLVLLLKGIY